MARAYYPAYWYGYPAYYADGGMMAPGGMDIPDGGTYVGEGGAHEENPYGGVRMGEDGEGNPNLVEEGEVVVEIDGEKYVFSDRLTLTRQDLVNAGLPTKWADMSFAEVASKIMEESGERELDEISRRGVDANLRRLRDLQEDKRRQMGLDDGSGYGGEEDEPQGGYGEDGMYTDPSQVPYGDMMGQGEDYAQGAGGTDPAAAQAAMAGGAPAGYGEEDGQIVSAYGGRLYGDGGCACRGPRYPSVSPAGILTHRPQGAKYAFGGTERERRTRYRNGLRNGTFPYPWEGGKKA